MVPIECGNRSPQASLKKLLFLLLFLPFSSVLAEEVTVRWENPTHNVDESEIMYTDKIMSATLFVYDDFSLVLQQSVIYPDGGHKTTAVMNLMCGGNYEVHMNVTNRLGETSADSNVITVTPEGCSEDPEEPVDPDEPVDPGPLKIPNPPILFTVDGVTQPLFSSGWVNRKGRPTIDWIYEPQSAFRLSEGYIVVNFKVNKSGILVSRGHIDSDNNFQIFAQTSDSNPKKEICVNHGGESMCDRGLFELGKSMTVIYKFGSVGEFGVAEGASLYIDGELRKNKFGMNAGFSEDNLPLVIGAGSYSVTGTYPNIDPAELGWWTRGDVSVDIYNGVPPSLQ